MKRVGKVVAVSLVSGGGHGAGESVSSLVFEFTGVGSGEWLLSADTFGEFGVAQLSIGVSVESADQGDDLGLCGEEVVETEEGTEVYSIDESVIVHVNGFPGSVHRPVVARLELVAETFSPVVEVDLQLDESGDVVLDVPGKSFEAADGVGWSLGDGCS